MRVCEGKKEYKKRGGEGERERERKVGIFCQLSLRGNVGEISPSKCTV